MRTGKRPISRISQVIAEEAIVELERGRSECPGQCDDEKANQKICEQQKSAPQCGTLRLHWADIITRALDSIRF